MIRIAIVSDIHYAGPREQAHGPGFEFHKAPPSLGRTAATFWRRHIWMRNPLAHNGLLDRFLDQTGAADLVIANGDYTCDTAGLGVSTDEACESVLLCLGKLRGRFGERLHASIGDHELGKLSLLGDHGGLRLESLRRAVDECGLRPFWRVEAGRNVLVGITSTLVGLEVFKPDALESEWADWEARRLQHLAEIRAVFAGLQQGQRVILFCHDPTALPFLWEETAVRERAGQIDCTIIGHLHTRLLLWKAQLLSGMPPVHGLGVSIKRMTTALNRARTWRPFKVRLCPSLAGLELIKRGGFLTMELDENGQQPPRVTLHPMRREQAQHQ
jgi:hypothetical protein